MAASLPPPDGLIKERARNSFRQGVLKIGAAQYIPPACSADRRSGRCNPGFLEPAPHPPVGPECALDRSNFLGLTKQRQRLGYEMQTRSNDSQPGRVASLFPAFRIHEP